MICSIVSLSLTVTVLLFNVSSAEQAVQPTQNATNTESSSNFGNIDFDTILKMKSIIDKMNTKDDPRSNLLQSLKHPHLHRHQPIADK